MEYYGAKVNQARCDNLAPCPGPAEETGAGLKCKLDKLLGMTEELNGIVSNLAEMMFNIDAKEPVNDGPISCLDEQVSRTLSNLCYAREILCMVRNNF